MKSKRKNILRVFSIFLTAFMLFNIFTINAYAKDGVLDEIKSVIKDKYVYDVPQEVLNAGSIDEAIKALGDPYTEYFPPKDYEKFVNSIDGKFSGIGVSIEVVPDGIKAASIIKGQPADEAGMKEGDIIISADGKSLKGMTTAEAVSYIRGEEGTIVKLVVKRADKFLNFSITRRIIDQSTVNARVLDGNIGYIDIISFGEDTPKEFKNELKQLKDLGVESYILDLRNNGGGYMSSAINIAEYFIGQRPSIATEDKSGNRVYYYELDNGIEIDKPVIFLINEYSASASEILSAAVKDYNKAFFIGNTTYGKGVAQDMFPLSDKGYLKLTTMKFYSPMGNVIHKNGVTPNLYASNSDSFLAAELLLGKSKPGNDKRGFIKIDTGNRSYELDINIVYNQKYRGALKSILEMQALQLYVGTDSGWEKVEKYSNEYWNLYCYHDSALCTISSVPVDKKFTVTFSKEIDRATVNDKNIKLIRAINGEKVPIKFDFINGKQVKVIPEKQLNKGERYYLAVDKSIKNANGTSMEKGSVTTINIKTN